MADQLVEELRTDQGQHARHRLALQLGLDLAQHLAHLRLDVGGGGAEHEVDRLLRQTELAEVVIERGAGAVLDDAAQRVDLPCIS